MTLKPPIHGRDHAPGGADPIPGAGGTPDSTENVGTEIGVNSVDPITGNEPTDYVLTSDGAGGSVWAPSGVGVFEPFGDAVATLNLTRDLIGYWRLGEPSSSFLDTSGQGSPANGTVTTVTTGLTRAVAGALPSGQDDGAVRFNDSDGTGSDYITTSSGGDGSRFNLSNEDMTLVAFVSPIASASSFTGNVIGQQGSNLRSWRLTVDWPLRRAVFNRTSASTSVLLTGPPLPADEFTFVVGTYSTTTGAKLYYNGALVAANSTTFSTGTSTNLDPYIGRGGSGHADLETTFYGTVDEISVWGDALTEDEIATLLGSWGQANDPEFLTVNTVTTTYSVVTGDHVILASGTFTVTLPTALAVAGKEYTIKNTGAGTITVAQTGSETIDGSASDLSLATTKESVTVVSDGVGWQIIGKYL